MDRARYNDPFGGKRLITATEAHKMFKGTVKAKSGLFRCIICGKHVGFIDNENGKQSPHFRHENNPNADCELKMHALATYSYSQYVSSSKEKNVEIGIGKIKLEFIEFQIKLSSNLVDQINNLRSVSKVIFKPQKNEEEKIRSLNDYDIKLKESLDSGWFTLSFTPYNQIEACFENDIPSIPLEGIYNDCTIFKDTQHPEKISKKRDTSLYYGESYLFLISNDLFVNSIFGKFPENCILSRYGDLLLIKGILTYNSPLCQLSSRVGYCYPVFKAISSVIMWPPFLRVNKEIVNQEKGYFAENIYYEQVESENDPDLRNSYITEREVNSNPLYKIVTDDDLSNNLLTLVPSITNIEVKNKLDQLVMSQDRPIKIPSIKGFHFLPKYDGEIICLRKNVPVRKESFLAENDCSIPEDYIQKGNEIQILYGRDCVWQISFIGKQEEDSLDKYTESELKRLMYVISTSHGSLVKFDRKYMRIVENSKVISIDLKRILKRYYLKGESPLRTLKIIYELTKKRGNRC